MTELVWDGWMASLTQWTWVWVSSGSWCWQGSLACCSPQSCRVGYDWATELNSVCVCVFIYTHTHTHTHTHTEASLVAQMVRICLPMQETRVWPLGQEDPLEKAMATHSSILARKSHGQRNLVVYSPWGFKESDTTEQLIYTSVCVCVCV